MNILETFPRDDLFQATTDDLYRITTGILNLQDRRKISAFVREDAYGRYVSCLVFVPRDNFNSQLIVRIQDVLMETFHGINVSYSTYFYTPILTRIHYIIRVEPKKKLEYNLDDLLLRLSLVAKSWQDGFKEAALDYFGEERGNQIVSKYGNAFSAGYREAFSPMHSVIDIEHIEALKLSDTLGMSLYRPSGSTPQEIKFKLFRYDQTVPLSDALPILENMGLRVIEERPYQLTFKEGRQVWINDFDMVFAKESSDITIESIETKINKQIKDVILLDEDRIFRRVLFVIKATLRTNFYQCDATNKCKVNLSFKLSPEKIPEMPLPLPKFEIFVYSPRFEGVHLRMAKVARGGLRWSDRREDFRTEVLGLMKAQQVKNAVIVPSGAKGGFVPKNLPINGTRDEIM